MRQAVGPALRVEAWGRLVGEPDCSLSVSGAAGPVLETIAAALGGAGALVRVALDGSTVTARTRSLTLRNLTLLLATSLVLPSVVSAVAVVQGPGRTRVDVSVRGGDLRFHRRVVPAALDRAVRLLELRGMRVVVGPWEGSARGPGVPL